MKVVAVGAECRVQSAARSLIPSSTDKWESIGKVTML